MKRIARFFKALAGCASDFAPRFLVLVFIFFLIRIVEFIFAKVLFGSIDNFSLVVFSAFVRDIAFFGSFTCWLFAGYFLVFTIHKQSARIAFIIFSILFCLIQVSLIKYFLTTLAPLGSDLWGYSFTEIKQTVGAAGSISLLTVLTGILLVTGIIFLFVKLPRRWQLQSGRWILLPLVSLLAQSFNLAAKAQSWKPETNTFSNYLATDKTYFFFQQSLAYFFPPDNSPDIYSDYYSGIFSDKEISVNNSFHYIDENNYPFLHTEQTRDVLSPFFAPTKTKPNIVIIVVEGLGRSFCNEGAPLGNFTPFLDSLSNHSLYWDNFLSEGGRTFAMLPSLTASLPFGKNGFAELGEGMPPQLNLLSLLKHNGYHTSFSYGGESHFDNMDIFLRHSGIDHISDIHTFPTGEYVKSPASASGFSWGYDDKDLFKRYLETLPTRPSPRLDILLTISTHSPFLIKEQQKYLDMVEARINSQGYSADHKEAVEKFKNQYATIMFLDDAIRGFFREYAKMPGFNNTIFLITGDHRMPEIPMSDKLERYHVPLIMYSPLLKRTALFASISTHFDVTPSLLAFLGSNYHLDLPKEVTWMGTGLDTFRTFGNSHAYPIMQNKTDLVDFIYGKYFLNGNDLYSINPNMGLTPINDDAMKNTLTSLFTKFKEKNAGVTAGARLMPDSVFQKYYPR